MSAIEVLSELDAWSLLRVVATAAFYACALLAIGAPLLRRALPMLPSEGMRCLNLSGALAAAAGLVLVLLQWPLQAGALGGGAAMALDPQLLGLVFESPLGNRMLYAGFGLGLLLAALRMAGRLRTGIEALGILCVLLAFAEVGHSRGEPRLMLVGLLLLHLLAVGFWLAALWPLWRITTDRPELPLAAVATLERFGRIGLLFVPVLLLAGLTLAWLLLGSLQSLVYGAYGQLLLIKLGLVSAVLSFAAFNKLALVPALAAGEPSAPARLRRSIGLEALLIAGVLLITASITSLVSPEPQDSGGPSASKQITATANADSA